ncbi:MAG TPA: TolC family protein [Flavobacteriales bacterium]|nr:TolC family protein [Flavobacteriales bacterium]
MRSTAFLLSLPLSVALFAQGGSLTLEQARAAALAHYPVSMDKALYLEAGELAAKNVGSAWLPQVKGTARATYQSEVTEFDLSAFGLAPITISKDQYQAGLEVQQTLYEFGSTHARREMELTKAQAQAAQADVDLLKVRENIDHLYGNILLQQENLRILRSRANEIAARQSKVESAVRNGVSLKSNAEVLRSESLTTQQRIVEASTTLAQLTSTLGILMGQPVDTTMVFTLPASPAVTNGGADQRPERKLFTLQTTNTELLGALTKKKNLPQLYAFADGYYGRPGFNFLNNDLRTYAIVGVGLSWNIAGYYTQGRELRGHDIQKQLIDDKRQAFDLQQRSDLSRQELDIAKLDRLAALDEQIVESKTEIRTTAASQLENGVITAQDYVTYQNAQDQAKLDLELHRIQAVMARIDHERTLGL